MKKIAVLVPAYKRPDYTAQCLQALEENTRYQNVFFYLVDDGSNDGTKELLESFKGPKKVVINEFNQGLRNTTIDFFKFVLSGDFDYVAKIDNDCLVPEGWAEDMMNIYEKYELDMLSPNVMPSDAAHRLGVPVEGYLKARIVGGLWFFRRELLEFIEFDKIGANGILGAHALVEQIQLINDAKVGWTADVEIQDLGHWSGEHEGHIKSKEHEDYSKEVGREILWKA